MRVDELSHSIIESTVLVYLGLGSNVHGNSNIRTGLDNLSLLMEDMDFSPVFVSETVGIKNDLFFNMVIRGRCNLSLASLVKKIKDIELATGRQRNSPEVTLDIDILMYGKEVWTAEDIVLPNPDIQTAAHVLYPLSIVAKDETHPVTGANFADLWAAWDRPRRLWPIPFEWRGIELTPRSFLSTLSISKSNPKQPVQYVFGQAVY